MSSQHYRSASATERRSATGPSRVNSTRVREDERSPMHDAGSPVLADGLEENNNNSDESLRKYEKRVNGTDRRREKTTVTTTETYLTKRSPLKEGSNVANRNPIDRRPRSMGSPVQVKRPKEPEKGTAIARKGLHDTDRISSTLGSSSVADTSFLCTTSCSYFPAAFVQRCAHRPCTRSSERDEHAGARDGAG